MLVKVGAHFRDSSESEAKKDVSKKLVHYVTL